MTDGEKIKYIRKATGLRQQEMAAILGISQQSLSKLEQNKSESIGMHLLRQLVLELNVNPYYFIVDGASPFSYSRHDKAISKP